MIRSIKVSVNFIYSSFFSGEYFPSLIFCALSSVKNWWKSAKFRISNKDMKSLGTPFGDILKTGRIAYCCSFLIELVIEEKGAMVL